VPVDKLMEIFVLSQLPPFLWWVWVRGALKP
jgi:hypothetical protein